MYINLFGTLLEWNLILKILLDPFPNDLIINRENKDYKGFKQSKYDQNKFK